MGTSKQFLIGFLSVVFVCGTVGLLTPTASQAEAFWQAPLVKKWFQKTVCGFRNPDDRFVISGDKVCDRTTGDIWEQDPDSYDMTTNPDGRIPRKFDEAVDFCKKLGKEKGHGQKYELPSIQQLVSVLDYMKFDPTLTPGVFSNVQSAVYWSVSSRAPFIPTFALVVNVRDGFGTSSRRTNPHFVWCVHRGKDAHADW